MEKTALIVVDVQYDFLPPHGSLAVPDGQAILPVIQDLLDQTNWDWPLIIASQDYHPRGHISFASTYPGSEPLSKKLVKNVAGREYEQTLWPDHCVQGTQGAEVERGISGALNKSWGGKCKLVRKGTHLTYEAYSAFEGYVTDAVDPAEPPVGHAKGSREDVPRTTELRDFLRSQGIEKVVVVGLAADFCVLQTALSALESFKTAVVAPAVRGISKEDSDRAFQQVRNLGGAVIGGAARNDWQGELRQWI
ncbi:hypothetical protein IAU60_005536 [Kwoniella sp. DSM 27419]